MVIEAERTASARRRGFILRSSTDRNSAHTNFDVGQADRVVHIEGPFPFRGEVIWLTPEQGGRRSGVPPVVPGVSYAHVAHVPPHTSGSGSASFVLRSWDPDAWRSRAEGRWLLVENEGDQLVVPGSVVVVAEGGTPVAFFRVDDVVGLNDGAGGSGRAWFRRAITEPASDLLDSVDVGHQLDPEGAQRLSAGIEGLFRSEVPSEYSGWPAGTTTDGSVVDICVRTAVDRLEVFGRTYVDFGPDMFPFRSLISIDRDRQATLELFIGDVDRATGAPPRLRDPVLVPVEDDEGTFVGVELIAGRHQTPIVWTTVLVTSS